MAGFGGRASATGRLLPFDLFLKTPGEIMLTVLENNHTPSTTNPAEQLRTTMAAVRVAFTWFGVRKTLSPTQKAEAAATFDAAGNYLSAGKKLLDTSHPAFKAVTTVRGRMISFWRGISLPFPDLGVRLIRQDDVPTFDVQFTTLKAELAEAVAKLDERYSELQAAARERLGRLFNPADYPPSLRSLFDVAWDFPAIEPPDYLRQLSPSLFAQEQARVAARFDEAVQLAEQAFIEELSRLVSHLTERLSGGDDGKPKIFRDSAIEHLAEFFQRFRQLNIGSNEALDDLVAQAQRIVRGIAPQQLRASGQLRQQVATQLSSVQSVLDGLLVDRPRRSLLRRAAL
jgi:hypothetical protein